MSTTSEALERSSLVLLGMAAGVIFGAIIQSLNCLAGFGILIVVSLLLFAVLLREWPYKNGTN